MTQIEPFPLWLGHAGDGRDFRHLLDLGIEAVVQLAVEEPVLQLPRDMAYCRFPLVDGEGNRPELIALAVQTAVHFLQNGVPVLVCCGAGLSRSPCIAAAALARFRQTSLEESMKAIAHHHQFDVSSGLWNEVKKISS